MRKMTIGLVCCVVGMLAFGAFGGDLQDSRLPTTAAVTTNALSGTIDAVGEVKLMRIDVSNANPITLTIREGVTGTVIYTNNALASDVVLIPRLGTTTSTGAAISWAQDGGTNVVYAPVNCLGLSYHIISGSNTANTVAIGVVTDKNP